MESQPAQASCANIGYRVRPGRDPVANFWPLARSYVTTARNAATRMSALLRFGPGMACSERGQQSVERDTAIYSGEGSSGKSSLGQLLGAQGSWGT
jgi:hypothetical protein